MNGMYANVYETFPGSSGPGAINADRQAAIETSLPEEESGDDLHLLRNSHLKKLEESFPNYPVSQVNGQSVFGPPSDLANIPIPRGCEVFVGSIPRDVYEDELVPLFAQVGRIYQLRLMMDFSGLNRGYGFVSFTTPEDAQRAIAGLDGYKIRPGKSIGVVPSFDNCKLFLRNIPASVSEEDLKLGLNNAVEGVVMVEMKNNRYAHDTRSAIVEFKTHRDAAMARRTLLPGQREIISGARIHVDWAQPPGRNNRNYHRTHNGSHGNSLPVGGGGHHFQHQHTHHQNHQMRQFHGGSNDQMSQYGGPAIGSGPGGLDMAMNYVNNSYSPGYMNSFPAPSPVGLNYRQRNQQMGVSTGGGYQSRPQRNFNYNY